MEIESRRHVNEKRSTETCVRRERKKQKRWIEFMSRGITIEERPCGRI